MLARPPRPIPLPRVSRADAERARQMSVQRAVLDLPNVKGFSLRMVSSDDDIPEPDDLIAVDATLDGAPFRVALSQKLVAELVGSLGVTSPIAELPADIAAMLLEAATASLLLPLEQTIGHSLSLRAVRGPTSPVGIALLLVAPDRVWPMTVSGDPAIMERLLGQWPIAGRDVSWLPMPARPRIGLTTLALPVLRSLRPGDVVVLQTWLGPADNAGPGPALNTMLVVSETFSAQAVVHGTTAELVEPVSPVQREWLMSGADTDPEEFETDLDDVPVRLAFDLGHLDMPLGEMRQLGAGMVLELGRMAADYVDISANGRRIGRGELVELDGQMGVRIIRIFARE